MNVGGKRIMRKIYADGFPGVKVYFTEADPSTQTIYQLTPDEFELKIKLWLLLTDHVILSTKHMLFSSITFNWLSQNANIVCELAKDEAILPSLREDREDFGDFVNRYSDQHDHLRMRANYRNILERARVLAGIFDKAITWSPMEESHSFRDMMVKDLKDKNSPLRKRLIGVSSEMIEYLAKEIAQCKLFHREKLQEFIRAYCPQGEKLLLRYGDIFYYISGALYKDAFPLFHQKAASLCLERVSYPLHTGNFNRRCEETWREITDVWGVTSYALQRLPLKEVMGIRKESLGRRVRETWGELLNEARQASIKDQTLGEFQQAKALLLDLLAKEVGCQKRRYKRFLKIRGIVEVASWATSGLATFFLTGDPFISAITGILGVLTGKPILDAIERKTPGTELVVLATKIQHEG